MGVRAPAVAEISLDGNFGSSAGARPAEARSFSPYVPLLASIDRIVLNAVGHEDYLADVLALLDVAVGRGGL
jgi:hypothetical protein